MEISGSLSDKLTELLLAVLRIERTQNEQILSIKNEITALKMSVQDQTSVNRRLLRMLERMQTDPRSNSTTQTPQVYQVSPDDRYIEQPLALKFDKKNNCEEMKLVNFTWALLADLIKKHREHEKLPVLTDTQVRSRVKQVKKTYPGVLHYFKSKFGLSDTVT
ncbi:hypothetical protein BJV82DRAFT_637921 [Fennellomyces sp. T-0311]|nr:hypothetical protein BJV82DRAFT_637921 [Fennellomyces sp. T-0311]